MSGSAAICEGGYMASPKMLSLSVLFLIVFSGGCGDSGGSPASSEQQNRIAIEKVLAQASWAWVAAPRPVPRNCTVKPNPAHERPGFGVGSG
jgi:hypothetical protein